MALAAGDRLGPYEVLSTLGAGGMGEVYRARDATLKRDVALKILPDGFALDPERLARFKREAQVLASLNHSNIAAIYGFEASTNSTSSGRAVQALILELVEGPTLADRIALGPIPVEEALPIARQIAEALEAAHEQGIVHRDLKPANVKLRPDGTVKVLDFGLAKTLDPVGVKSGDATASPTITSPAMTAMGLILGTAAYMSPEQAKGRQADKRSDVWAFGAVLYEMLSGQRAFKGDDVSDTLAAVLRQDVDLTALPASTPAPVRRLIARCLDRDVRRRLRDIGEARIVLDDPAALVTDSAKDGLALVPPRPLWRRAIPAMLAAIVAGGLAGIAVWYLKPSPPLTVTRLQFTLPEAQRFGGIDRRMIDISPDGTHLVYVASGRLYLRAMADHDAKEIQGTDGYQAVKNPVFSPDGRSVAFHAFSDQTLKKIAVTGGAAVTICPSDLPFGMSWGPDGIVFAQRSKGISRVSPDGGTPDVLVDPKDGEVSESPQMLPGGQYGTLHAGNRHCRKSMGLGPRRGAVDRDRGTKDHRGRRRCALPRDRSPRLRRRRQRLRRPIRRAASGGDGQSRAGGRRRHASVGAQRRSRLQHFAQRHSYLCPWHKLVVVRSQPARPDGSQGKDGTAKAPARSLCSAAGGARRRAHRLWDR